MLNEAPGCLARAISNYARSTKRISVAAFLHLLQSATAARPRRLSPVVFVRRVCPPSSSSFEFGATLPFILPLFCRQNGDEASGAVCGRRWGTTTKSTKDDEADEEEVEDDSEQKEEGKRRRKRAGERYAADDDTVQAQLFSAHTRSARTGKATRPIHKLTPASTWTYFVIAGAAPRCVHGGPPWRASTLATSAATAARRSSRGWCRRTRSRRSSTWASTALWSVNTPPACAHCRPVLTPS